MLSGRHDGQTAIENIQQEYENALKAAQKLRDEKLRDLQKQISPTDKFQEGYVASDYRYSRTMHAVIAALENKFVDGTQNRKTILDARLIAAATGAVVDIKELQNVRNNFYAKTVNHIPETNMFAACGPEEHEVGRFLANTVFNEKTPIKNIIAIGNLLLFGKTGLYMDFHSYFLLPPNSKPAKEYVHVHYATKKNVNAVYVDTHVAGNGKVNVNVMPAASAYVCEKVGHYEITNQYRPEKVHNCENGQFIVGKDSNYNHGESANIVTTNLIVKSATDYQAQEVHFDKEENVTVTFIKMPKDYLGHLDCADEDYKKKLWELYQQVQMENTVIHCDESGIERTGYLCLMFEIVRNYTQIFTDNSPEESAEEILEIVQRLRKARPGLVNTSQQLAMAICNGHILYQYGLSRKLIVNTEQDNSIEVRSPESVVSPLSIFNKCTPSNSRASTQPLTRSSSYTTENGNIVASPTPSPIRST